MWEPPILDYSLYIGDEYGKQRKAPLKLYKGNVGKATRYLEVEVERELHYIHFSWVNHESVYSSWSGDHGVKKTFFMGSGMN